MSLGEGDALTSKGLLAIYDSDSLTGRGKSVRIGRWALIIGNLKILLELALFYLIQTPSLNLRGHLQGLTIAKTEMPFLGLQWQSRGLVIAGTGTPPLNLQGWVDDSHKV